MLAPVQSPAADLNAAPVRVPQDFAAAMAADDWRQEFTWPLALESAAGTSVANLRRRVEAVRDLPAATDRDREIRDLAILAGGAAHGPSQYFLETALAIEAGRARGIELFGDSAEFRYLAGDLAEKELPPLPAVLVPARPPRAWARRIARAATWTPPWRLPLTLTAPMATAVTHNELMAHVARTRVARVSFRHAEGILHDACQKDVPPDSGLSGAIIDLLLGFVGDDPDLSPEMASRLRHLVARQARPAVDAAVRDLGALRRVRSLPMTVWASTGGYPPSRALALEVIRRGGHVTRFDHGYNRAVHGIFEYLVWLDLFAGQKMVMPTVEMATRLDRPEVRHLLPKDMPGEIEGFAGRSPLTRFARAHATQPAAGQPRVLYAPHLFRGARQTVPSNLPDVVYLDWQLRLAETLTQLDVDLTVRPHPGGLARGRPHPLSRIVSLADRPFEQLIPSADVFLFDSPGSSVFMQALVTDRPVVFIDFGAPYFAPDILPIVAQRCRMIPAGPDERGLPQVDRQALQEALADPARPDPAALFALRELLLGRAEAEAVTHG